MIKARKCITQQDAQHLGQILPSAILTAAEKAAEAKELATRHRSHVSNEALIFADGFAIGLAFVLEVGTFALLVLQIVQQNTITSISP